MIVLPGGDSNDLFVFDPDEMQVFSKDGSATVLAKAPFGRDLEYMTYAYAIEWRGGVYCFKAQIDFVRDEKGKAITIDEAGRKMGIFWKDVRLEGTVRDPFSKNVYRSEAISDPKTYQAFGELVVKFLSVNRVIRNYPPVRLIAFDLAERFRPAETKPP